MRESTRRHRYEFGPATIFVYEPSSGTDLDGLVKVKFSCHVHPADGSHVRYFPVWTFYPFLAANEALEEYNKQRQQEMQQDGTSES